MRNTILSVLALLCSFFAYCQTDDKPQIPNGDFETWTIDGANLPNNFNSFQTADGTWSSTAYSKNNRQVERSTDRRPGSTGSYSCKIWSRKILGIVAQGNLTSGRIHAGSTTATSEDNYNFSDRLNGVTFGSTTNACAMKFKGMPDSMVVWVKFVPGGNDSAHPYAMVNAYIHDDYNFKKGYSTVSASKYIVASTEVSIASTAGQWKRLSLPFTYGKCKNPKYILINITTNEYPGGGSANDNLWIDDIEMIYNPSSYDVVIPSANAWASVCLNFKASIPDGVEAYIATEMVGGYVKLRKLSATKAIPANTAFLIKSGKENVTFSKTLDTAADVSDNILEGSTEAGSVDDNYNYYVLSGDATTPECPAFGLFKGSSLAANKAYIKIRK